MERTPSPEDIPGDPEDLRLFLAFQHFEDQELELLAPIGRRSTVARGDTILQAETDGEDFFVLLAGSVSCRRDTPVGHLALGDLRSGAIFGELSFLDGGVRSISVRATQNGMLLRFPASAARRAMAKSPDLEVALLRAFWKSLAVKLRLANRAMAALMAGKEFVPRRGSGERGRSGTMAPAEKVAIFRAQGLDTPELALLAATLPVHEFTSNQLVFAEGQDADALYVIARGEVRISRRFAESSEEAIAILGPGEAFGEMALIDDQRRSADAFAHVDGCTLLVVSKSDFQDIVEIRSPAALEFLRLFCRVLTCRLREMIELLVKWRILVGPFG